MATTFPDAPDFIDPKKKGRRANSLAAKGLTEESLLARREKVFQMRAVDRLSYDEIAQSLGVSVGTAYTDARWMTKFKVKGLIEKDKSIVVEQNTIYRALLDRWLPVALGEAVIIPGKNDDDPIELSYSTSMYATDRVARLLVDMARLNGFQASSSKDYGAAREVTEAIGTKVLEAMMKLASGQRGQVVEAEVIQPAIEDAEN